MANRFDLGEDYGTATFVVGGTEITLDLWVTHWQLADLYKKHRDGSTLELHADLSAYVGRLGFPEMSGHMIERFATAVFDAVGDLKKKVSGERRPDSPGSTG